MDQTKMLQLEILKEQGQQMAQQKAQISMQMQELELSKAAISDLKRAKKDTEMMVPIGTGMYIKGRMESAGDVIVSIGAGVAVGKTLDEAEKIVDERKERMDELERQIDTEIEKIDREGTRLMAEIRAAESKNSHNCDGNCGHAH